MEKVNKLELKVASWYKGLPHLPENGRKWLANNIWWIVIIGVVLGALALIAAFNLLLFSKAIMNTYGIVESTNHGALSIFAFISIVLLAADLIISAMAISPLKSLRKRGWSLLFITLLLNLASAIVGLLYDFDFSSLISGVLGTAIGGYFLFEIRDSFGVVKTSRKSTPAPVTTPKKA